MPRINGRASFTELLSVQNSKAIQHKTPLSCPQQNAQLLQEASADMEGREETGDWGQWYPHHKLYVRVILGLCEHQTKTSPRGPGHWSNLSQPLLSSHKHNSSQLLLSSVKRVSPLSGWSQADPTALWSCTGLFRRMWIQCPVSYRRGWPETYWILGAEPGALGQSGRLRLSRAGLEVRHLQEPKRGFLSTEDSPEPLGMGLGVQEASSVLLSALDSSVVTLGGSSEFLLS